MTYTKRINKIFRKMGAGIPGNQEDANLNAYDQARDQIALMGTGAIEDLLSIFKTANYGQQQVIVRSIGKIGGDKAITALESLLQDPAVYKDVKPEISFQLSMLNEKS